MIEIKGISTEQFEAQSASKRTGDLQKAYAELADALVSSNEVSGEISCESLFGEVKKHKQTLYGARKDEVLSTLAFLSYEKASADAYYFKKLLFKSSSEQMKVRASLKAKKAFDATKSVTK